MRGLTGVARVAHEPPRLDPPLGQLLSCCLLRKRTLGRYCFPTPLCAAAGGGEGAGPVERE